MTKTGENSMSLPIRHSEFVILWSFVMGIRHCQERDSLEAHESIPPFHQHRHKKLCHRAGSVVAAHEFLFRTIVHQDDSLSQALDFLQVCRGAFLRRSAPSPVIVIGGRDIPEFSFPLWLRISATIEVGLSLWKSGGAFCRQLPYGARKNLVRAATWLCRIASVRAISPTTSPPPLGQGNQSRVIVRVIADLVTPCVQLAQQVRIPFRVATDDKEGCLDSLVEQVAA
jgi:hypothetical protein